MTRAARPLVRALALVALFGLAGFDDRALAHFALLPAIPSPARRFRKFRPKCGCCSPNRWIRPSVAFASSRPQVRRWRMPADTSIRTMIAGHALAGAAANVPIWDAFGQPTADLLLRGRFASTWWPRLLLEITAAVILIFGGLDSTG